MLIPATRPQWRKTIPLRQIALGTVEMRRLLFIFASSSLAMSNIFSIFRLPSIKTTWAVSVAITVYCLRFTDYWLLVTAYLPKWGFTPLLLRGQGMLFPFADDTWIYSESKSEHAPIFAPRLTDDIQPLRRDVCYLVRIVLRFSEGLRTKSLYFIAKCLTKQGSLVYHPPQRAPTL